MTASVTLAFDGDGQNFAYVGKARIATAFDRPKFTSFLVVNGRKGPEYDHIYAPTFGPDGARLAYVGVVVEESTGKAKSIVASGSTKSASYDAVAIVPTFTDDGAKVRFGAVRGSKVLWAELSVQ